MMKRDSKGRFVAAKRAAKSVKRADAVKTTTKVTKTKTVKAAKATKKATKTPAKKAVKTTKKTKKA